MGNGKWSERTLILILMMVGGGVEEVDCIIDEGSDVVKGAHTISTMMESTKLLRMRHMFSCG